MKKYKTFNILLQEELDTFVNNLQLKKINSKKKLNELFTMNITNFMKDIGSQEIDEDTEIDTELWDWFMQTIDESMKETSKEWKDLLKEQKIKILCYKFFTKKELIEKDQLEQTIKKQIRKFFTALQNYTDLDGFREKISNLPSELLSNLTRYLFSYSDQLSSSIKVTKDELSQKIKDLTKSRLEMVEKIDMISKSYQTVLDLTKLKELYDHGVFFEDNIINRGINEYTYKLVTHKEVEKTIKDIFSNTLLTDLKSQSQTSSAYINHIESIKTDQGQEFFTVKGFQIGNRFSNEIEAVKDRNIDKNSIIDKNSVFKEPKSYISNVVSPWEKDNTLAPGNMDANSISGGSSSGGSSGSFDSDSPLSSGGFSGNNFESPVELQGESDPEGDILAGSETNSDSEGETDLPTNDQGFPVDFGTAETNPDAADDTDMNDEKK